MLDRDLDATIVEEIFGWRLTDVGVDAKGENSCQVLTQAGEFPDAFELPRLGKMHRGYFAPFYSSRWDEAIKLAKHVGLDLPISKLPGTPHELSKACLDHYRESPCSESRHNWVRRRMGGSPDMAESLEVVEYCDVCGVENLEAD